MADKLTEKETQVYLAVGGSGCPRCRSPDIEGGHIEIVGGSAHQVCHCNACSLRWRDLYTLTGVELVT